MDTETPRTLASAADQATKLHVSLGDLVKLATTLQADLVAIAAILKEFHQTAVSTGSLPPDPVPEPKPAAQHFEKQDKKH